jgi:MarR family transcriptional regulator, 2-MHQ and catechol-resistance regulon repressor
VTFLLECDKLENATNLADILAESSTLAVTPTDQTSGVDTPALTAWARLLRGYTSLARTFSAQLLAEHDLTINDYEALLVLANADGRRLRRTDLAQSLQLTASGVTRLLDGLERAGLVCKAQCASDARVTYAVLTDAGETRLRAASRSHAAAVEALFGERYDGGELGTLVELLGRLPNAADGGSCTAPA